MRTRLFRSTDGEVFREQIVDEPGQADIRHPRWNPDTGQWEADEGRLSEYLFFGRGDMTQRHQVSTGGGPPSGDVRH